MKFSVEKFPQLDVKLWKLIIIDFSRDKLGSCSLSR